MRKRTTAPCIRKRIYTEPERFNKSEREAAALVCRTECPFLMQCAKEALTAGNSLDGSVILPAQGVIAAGVICPSKGTDHAVELAEIAEQQQLPRYRTKRDRPIPERCAECKTPMASWNREKEAPEGYVVHYARGYCIECRTAYLETVKQSKAKGEAPNLPQFNAGERPDHWEQVAWILRNRPLRVKRPSRCIDCDTAFSESTVSYGGRGLCRPCWAKWRGYIKAFGYRKNKLVA